MKRINLFLILCSLILSACDDGRIYEKPIVIPQEGLTVKLTGNVSGIQSWPEKYSIVIAGFNKDSEYAVISKVVTPAENGDVLMTMSGIKEEVTSLELCVINRLRQRIVSYYTLEDFTATGDTVYMDVNSVNLGMYNTIQATVFDENCVNCHGRSTNAAKDLFLTADKSYDALVNKPSKVDGDMLLVEPENAQESFLHVVLNRNGDTTHDHADILSTKPLLLSLIDDWINDGAKN